MQIKSWQIAFLTIIPYSLLILWLFIKGAISSNAGLIVLMIMFISPVWLLNYDKSKFWGAVLSILLGIGLLISLFAQRILFKEVVVLLFPGILLPTAGLYYFWKKV